MDVLILQRCSLLCKNICGREITDPTARLLARYQRERGRLEEAGIAIVRVTEADAMALAALHE